MATKEQIEAAGAAIHAAQNPHAPYDYDERKRCEHLARIAIDAANAPLLKAVRLAYDAAVLAFELNESGVVEEMGAALRPFLESEARDA